MTANGSFVRRACALFLCAVTVFYLIGVLSPKSAAETVDLSAYTKLSQEVDSDLLYNESEEIDVFSDTELWEGGSTVKNISDTRYNNGKMCVLVTADNKRRRTLSFSRDIHQDVSDWKELYFTFLALGTPDAVYNLAVTLTSGEDRYSYSARIVPNEWNDVFIDLAPFGAESVDRITFSVSGRNDPSAYVTSAAMSELTLGDTSHGAFARRFSALYVYGGDMTEDEISVTPKENSASLRADALFPEAINTSGATVMISVIVRGISYAKLSVSVSSSPAWKQDEYREMTSVTVTPETDTYVCCFDGDGKISSWALTFSGVSTLDGDSFEVCGVRLSTGGDKIDDPLPDTALGRVTKCVYTSPSPSQAIQISGTVTRDGAVSFIDGELRLYMIPVWQSAEDAALSDPVMTLDVSTEFTFSLPLSSYPQAAGCRFAVALASGDEQVFISYPLWPSPASVSAQTKLPRVTVSAPTKDGAFASGASGALISVDISKLSRQANANNGRLAAWGDSFFYLNESVLSPIASQVEFYSACGMQIFFTLYCSTDKFAVATDIAASGYAIDVSEKQNADLLAAVVSYLCDRYSPSGFILSEGLNDPDRNASLKSGDMFSVMSSAANAARLIYSVATQKKPSSAVFLAFDAVGDVIGADAVNSASETKYSAIACTALADFYIARGSTAMKWGAVVSVGNEGSGDVPSQAATNHGSGYLGCAVACELDDSASFDDLAADYPYALFYCVPLDENGIANSLELSDTDVTISSLDKMGAGMSGSVPVWDFRKAYSAGSWVCSGTKKPSTQLSTVMSAATSLSACRALHLDLTGDGDETSQIVAAANAPANLNLSDCDAVSFELAAFSAAPSCDLVIHVGDGANRYAFPVTVKSGAAVSVMCILPEGMTPVYFALSAKNSDSVSLDVVSVTAHSSGLSSEELAGRVQSSVRSDAVDSPVNDDRNFFYAAATLIAVTVAVFIILNRRRETPSDSFEKRKDERALRK